MTKELSRAGKFWRTVGGKTIIYFLAVILPVLLFCSIILVFLNIDLNIYSRSYESTREERIRSTIEEECMDEIYEYQIFKSQAPGSFVSANVTYQIYEGEELIRWSNDSDKVASWEFEDSFEIDDVTYSYKANLDRNFPEWDGLKMNFILFNLLYALRYWILAIIVVLLVLIALVFRGLVLVAGRHSDDDGLYPGPLYKVPFDLMVVGVVCLLTIIAAMFASCDGDVAIIVFMVFLAFMPGIISSFACRIKAKSLISNLLIVKALKFLRYIFKNLPIIWKTLFFVSMLLVFDLFMITLSLNEERFLFFLITRIGLVPFVLWMAVLLRKLSKQAEKMAAGDFDYKMDYSWLYGDFRKHARNLDSISEGMNIALESRLKSERMKTELITNVSHDIKTPLTSIINYCSLIEKDKTDPDKVASYSEVVIRQSNKLKKLLEDLVEASKATTGNLEVDLKPSDASTFVTQLSGEYEEKMKERDLSLVVKLPEDTPTIMADGRHMWRVFDNVMNNALNYSLEGTRIFLTMEQQGENVVFVLKNTSKEPLDISEEELMERFVRGDSARHTEGSGLGLSIARSLSELQGGHLDIQIDGDFFKAILTFPVLREDV